jgi:hypothetical protein
VRHLRQVALPVAALLGFVVVFAGVLRLLEPPTTIDRVTVENRSGTDIEVGVTDESRDGELLLAAVDPGASTRVDEVIDQGSSWVFRITHAGDELGTVERSRDRLQDDGWRVVVPADLGEPSAAPSG